MSKGAPSHWGGGALGHPPPAHHAWSKNLHRPHHSLPAANLHCGARIPPHISTSPKGPEAPGTPGPFPAGKERLGDPPTTLPPIPIPSTYCPIPGRAGAEPAAASPQGSRAVLRYPGAAGEAKTRSRLSGEVSAALTRLIPPAVSENTAPSVGAKRKLTRLQA